LKFFRGKKGGGEEGKRKNTSFGGLGTKGIVAKTSMSTGKEKKRGRKRRG